MDTLDNNLLEKMLLCLERIAYCATPTNLELEAFKKEVLYANSGSNIPLQKGNKNTPSTSKRESPRGEKHVNLRNTYPPGIRGGPKEETDEEILAQVP